MQTLQSAVAPTHTCECSVFVKYSSALIHTHECNAVPLECSTVGKVGEDLVHFLTRVTSRTGQFLRTWMSQENFTRSHALEHDYSESKDGSAQSHFYIALQERVGKIVKPHSNILVVLTHVQWKYFYHLSTRDVIHVKKCTRPSPTSPYVLQVMRSWARAWEQGYKYI